LIIHIAKKVTILTVPVKNFLTALTKKLRTPHRAGP
jgi:hypothetical protein